MNNGAMAADCQAGGLKGLAVVTGTTAATVCSKLILFIIYKNITRLLGLAGLFEYLSILVCYLKKEVTKYIFIPLRIFKIAPSNEAQVIL